MIDGRSMYAVNWHIHIYCNQQHPSTIYAPLCMYITLLHSSEYLHESKAN